MTRMISIGVTLDGLTEYAERFQISREELALSPDEPDPVYGRAWPRFLAFCARLGASATFFVVGRYLQEKIPVALAREALGSGHEIANHTFSAPAAFGRLKAEKIRAEIREGEEAIREATGTSPRGFSAPWHQASGEALAALVERGYAYDASVLPQPAYFAARAGVLGLLRSRGLSYDAPVGGPGSLLAPRRPYHPSLKNYALRGKAPLWELPVTSLPGVRLPLTGSVLALLGPEGARLFARLARRESFVYLLLGGADFLEPDEIPSPLLAKRRALNRPLEERIRELEDALGLLVEGAEMATLEEAVRRLGS